MPKRASVPKAGNPGEHLAIRYYRLGCQLLECDEVAEEEFEQLATSLNLKATYDTWYKSIRLAKRFKGNKAGLETLCRLRTNGRGLGWSHIVELLQVTSATQRERFAALVVRHNLDSAALREEIRRTAGRTSLRPRSGRKQREPRNKLDAAWRAEVEIGRLKTTIGWLVEKSEPKRVKKELSSAVMALDSLQKSLKRMFVGQ